MLRAFAELKEPQARLMLIGNGPLETELKAFSRSLGIADRVIFPGFEPDPTPFYKTADLFVLSSDYEGFGNVIIEALACGTPVVSTDCPTGPAEILANGKFGRLTPVDEVGAFAEAIRETLLQDRRPEELRARARDFALEQAAQAYLDLLFPAEGSK